MDTQLETEENVTTADLDEAPQTLTLEQAQEHICGMFDSVLYLSQYKELNDFFADHVTGLTKENQQYAAAVEAILKTLAPIAGMTVSKVVLEAEENKPLIWKCGTTCEPLEECGNDAAVCGIAESHSSPALQP
jgi:hypothetical protein